MDFLTGYRSYILAAATLLGGVVMLIDGKYVEGFTAISAALGVLFSRKAVSNLEGEVFGDD